jgi:hypothetical protein
MRRMTKPTDLSLSVLKQIRDAVTQTNVRLDETRGDLSQRLDQTREELSQRLEQLARRQTETEIRLATELTAVVGAVHSLRDAVVADRELRKTVENHEQRLSAIERCTG